MRLTISILSVALALSQTCSSLPNSSPLLGLKRHELHEENPSSDLSTLVPTRDNTEKVTTTVTATHAIFVTDTQPLSDTKAAPTATTSPASKSVTRSCRVHGVFEFETYSEKPFFTTPCTTCQTSTETAIRTQSGSTFTTLTTKKINPACDQCSEALETYTLIGVNTVTVTTLQWEYKDEITSADAQTSRPDQRTLTATSVEPKETNTTKT